MKLCSWEKCINFFRNSKHQLSALMMEAVGFSEKVNFSQTPQSPDIFSVMWTENRSFDVTGRRTYIYVGWDFNFGNTLLYWIQELLE
jgi:hypothetical protein